MLRLSKTGDFSIIVTIYYDSRNCIIDKEVYFDLSFDLSHLKSLVTALLMTCLKVSEALHVSREGKL